MEWTDSLWFDQVLVDVYSYTVQCCLDEGLYQCVLIFETINTIKYNVRVVVFLYSRIYVLIHVYMTYIETLQQHKYWGSPEIILGFSLTQFLSTGTPLLYLLQYPWSLKVTVFLECMLIKIHSLKSLCGIWHNKISECIKKIYYLQNNVLRYAVEFKTAKKHYIYSLFK